MKKKNNWEVKNFTCYKKKNLIRLGVNLLYLITTKTVSYVAFVVFW